MVRATWQGGERPAIDTLEALTQVQAIAIRQQEVLGELLKMRLELSAFLWTENEKQYDLPADAVPQSREGNQQLLLDDLLRNANQHPLLTQYEQKLDILTIERRLKFQGLLPKADLKYNQIGSTFSKTASAAWFQNNYRFGISFSMPLRLSQGRGEYRMAKLKIEQTTLEQLNKTVQVQTKVRQYYTDWQQTNQQLVLQEQMLRNVTALQRGEEVKFENGESSLFLINARELKTMETVQKLVELQSKNQKALIQVQWAAGYFGR
ncbi:MAG TPA: TolC family protein [Flavisolibacter sp.]|nr:TolC family protein [Flavisolibacter sp.]